MATQTSRLPARLSRWLLACAIRHWPEETRAWGMALAAEIDETNGALESLVWSLGGIMLFAREVLGSMLAWLKLSPGTRAGDGTGRSNLPRRSRLLTVGLLIAAAVVLLSPQGRDAIATARSSWDNFQQSPSDRRTLDRLATRAGKEQDAATLAFVAISTDDAQQATVLADRAVSLNPELIWIYGLTRLSAEAREQRLQRLQAADPGNAVPVILAADSLAGQIGAVLSQHLSPTEIRAKLAGDPEWMALMARALSLPRYDRYEQRRVELTRKVWNTEGDLSPTIAFRMWSPGNPLGSLLTFCEIRAEEAKKAFATGDLKQAERLLGEVDSFGERMANDEKSTTLEKAIGLDLVENASLNLGKFYTSIGRTSEAQRFGVRLQQATERQARLWDPARFSRIDTFHRAGFLVQGFGVLAAMAGFAALAGILGLELSPGKFRNRKTALRGILCWMADYGPVTALVAGCALILSFLPFARAFSEYRTSGAPISSTYVCVQGLWEFGYSHEYVWRAQCTLWLWALGTAALSALAILILFRSFYRGRLGPATI